MMILAAHPDDETIGAGVLVSRSPGAQVVYATDGSPDNLSDALASGFSTQEAYARARRKEAVNVLGRAGIGEGAIRDLGFTDQQVSFCLEELTFRIMALVEEIKPGIVLGHAYEGGHPDHDAVALACHLAYEIQSKGGSQPSFALWEFTGYHAENGRICPYEFLPCRNRTQHRYRLSREEQRLKIEMLAAYETQSRTLEPFMSPQFEVFRRAPTYDFSRTPHEGRLFYEYFNWGVDGKTWRNLATEVVARLAPWRLAS